MRNTYRFIRLMMMVSLSASFFAAVAQGTRDEVVKKINDHRKEQEGTFRDPEKSPLDKKERRKFKGLNYYPIDLAYSVPARFIKNETPVLFKMKTTTTRLPDY